MLIDVPAPAEMAEWDGEAAALGMPGQVLMENAARAATAVLRNAAGGLQGKRVLLFAGGGNNGGDVFCMARHMLDEGAEPLLVHTRPRERYSGDAGYWLSVAETLGVPMLSSDEWEASLAGAEHGEAAAPDVIVDGILGTGFHGSVREKELGIIRKINTAGAGTVLSVDVPSGLDALSGRACPEAVRADVTVTFQAPKPGLLLPEAARYTGRTCVAPIGIPRAARRKASFRTMLLPFQSAPDGGFTVVRNPGEAAGAAAFPGKTQGSACPRDLPPHKGAAGRVLVAGGCTEYAGAPCLAAHAALRAGAGLVSLAAPDTVRDAARVFQPALTMRALRSGCGQPVRSWDDVLPGESADIVRGAGCVVLGPGMGRSRGVALMLEALLSRKDRPPFVIDADALNALAEAPSMMSLLREDDILTPHPGEAGRLLGISAAEVQGSRFEAASGLAGLARAVWILKGEGTLISMPGRPTVISPWSVPQLAVAGSGDVLSGIAGAFLASGMEAGDAAVRAVWVHALAGVVLAKRFPRRGCTPLDIADAVPEAVSMVWD